MLTNEEMKEYMKKITTYMKNSEAQTSQICIDLKDLANVFHSLLVIKENGNYGMMDAVVIQFQITLSQLPQDIKSEMKQKLRDLIVNFARKLDFIAENLENLESGNMEIFKMISNMFLYVENLFKLKDLLASAYPRPPPFPM